MVLGQPLFFTRTIITLLLLILDLEESFLHQLKVHHLAIEHLGHLYRF